MILLQSLKLQKKNLDKMLAKNIFALIIFSVLLLDFKQQTSFKTTLKVCNT